MRSQTRFAFLLSVLLLTCSANGFSQGKIQLPMESQQATVTQRIGVTDISVVYHRPLVKGRKIWGGLVPYNTIWRGGANENTTISFTHDVTVDGKPLAAGIYGLHMIPTESEWTIIFSKNHTAWGSFSYKETEDALRIKVKPASAEFKECLSYEFTELKSNSALLSLHWENLKVPFKIEADVQNIVLQDMRTTLNSGAALTWRDFYEAAFYCNKNNVNMDEAFKWIEESIKKEEHFTNLQLKAKMLEKKGNTKEADEATKKALTLATENELNTYGYQLIGQKKIKEAIEIFKMNVKAHPESWNAYDSLAEAYEADGDKKQAIKTYDLALKKAPDDQKSRIKGILEKLQKK